MRVGIYGPTGFLGESLLWHLKQMDVCVYTDKVHLYNCRTFLRSQNLVDDQLMAFLEYTDVVIYLSQIGTPINSEIYFPDNTVENLSLFAFFLHALKSLDSIKLPRIIYVSSGGMVYGAAKPSECGLTENFSCNPITPYGISKYINERLLAYLGFAIDLNYTIVRPSNVYGKLSNINSNQGVIGVWASRLRHNQPLVVPLDLNIVRDYIHVTDFCEAIRLLIGAPVASGNIYNVGTCIGTSLYQLLKLFRNVSPTLKTLPRFNENSKNIIQWNVLNYDKIKSDLGWEPKIDVKAGISSLLS